MFRCPCNEGAFVIVPSSPLNIVECLSRARRGVLGGTLVLDDALTVTSLDERARRTVGHLTVEGTSLPHVLGFLPARAPATPTLYETSEPGPVVGVVLAPNGEGQVLAALLLPSVAEVAFESLPGAAVVTDAEARVIAVNERARALFGPAEAIEGLPLLQLIPSPVLVQLLKASMAGAPTPGHVSFEWSRPEGRRTFEFICTHGTTPFPHCVVSLADVTEARLREVERERLLEAVHQSQKLDAIGQLASGVAHDLNNVLAVVQTCASALKEEVSEPLHKADAEQILLASQRAKDLLHSLLAFSRKSPTRSERFDAVEMVREAMSLVQRLLPAAVRLELRVPDAPRFVEGDRSQLQQTLINLSLNARDAMPNGGVLRVAAHANDRRLTFTVSDTGQGMSKDVRQRAFEPFFTTKPRGSGTGLGLSMAWTTLRAHGGDIRLESEPGRGTTVTAWMPLELGLPESDGVTPLPRTRGIAVVVDDDEATRKVLARFLKKLGYVVHLAASGEEAVSLLRAGLHPSLVVCDLVLPGLDGAETVTQLKALEPAISVVLTSGFLDEPQAVGTPDVAGLLRKPFSMDDVVQVVSRLPS
jgi:signal transduction histidine kinase/CheY-like chemotaxis protein